MSVLWFPPLHSGLAGHNWLAQALVFVLIAGVWLFISGNIARRSANRRQQSSSSPRNTHQAMVHRSPGIPANP
jgi:site-specific recombinase